MTQPPTADSPNRLSPDDALPDVEPPSTGFIVQLFIVPAVIVGVIVMVYTLFHWLAYKDQSPQKLVDSLERDSATRWQSASALADLLRTQGNTAQQDAKLAARLATLLEADLNDGGWNDQEILFRGFLCRALGEFKVTDGASALTLAATTQRNEADIKVRRAAIEALAVLSMNVGPDKLRAQPQVLQTLLSTAGDAEPVIRSASAVALGSVGGSDAIERLNRMLSDPKPSVRFNAATGLARHGDARSIEVLAEMLDPAPITGVEQGDDTARRLTSGLQAVSILARQNGSTDLAPLAEAVEALTRPSSAIHPQLRLKAREVWQDELRERSVGRS
jgi:HEAT repeat protein